MTAVSAELIAILTMAGTKLKLPGLPFELDGQWFSTRKGPPAVSAHAREILDELGIEREVVDRLAAEGKIVLPDPPAERAEA